MAGLGELAARLRAQNPELFPNVGEARRVMDAVLAAIQAAAGEGVRLPGFGTFAVRKRGERKGMDPQTRQPIRIPARDQVTFKPARAAWFGYSRPRREDPWAMRYRGRQMEIEHLVRTIRHLRRLANERPERAEELGQEIADKTTLLRKMRPGAEALAAAGTAMEKPSWAESFREQVNAEATRRGILKEQDLFTSIGFAALQFVTDLLSQPARYVARKLRLVDEDPEQVKAALEVIADEAGEEQP